MVLKDGWEEIPREKTKHSWAAPLTEEWTRQRSEAGSFPLPSRFWRPMGAAPQPRGFQAPACAWLSLLFPEETELLLAAPVGSAGARQCPTGLSELAEEKMRFSMWSDSVAMPNGFGGLRRATMDQAGNPPSTLQKAAWVFQMVGGQAAVDCLCPSTINKVQHEWRLSEPLVGGETTITPQRMEDRFLQQNAGCWGFHYCSFP